MSTPSFPRAEPPQNHQMCDRTLHAKVQRRSGPRCGVHDVHGHLLPTVAVIPGLLARCGCNSGQQRRVLVGLAPQKSLVDVPGRSGIVPKPQPQPMQLEMFRGEAPKSQIELLLLFVCCLFFGWRAEAPCVRF